jgi:4-hydroxy-3-methylbut-2-enyl diphosphate reductase
MIEIEIDPRAGFCFGVTRVVQKAEELITQYGKLYCLGEIVHNRKEIERLGKLGLVTINAEEYRKLSDCRVLIRAHGEPPETYSYARRNNIELIDGTCPIVLKLQSRIKNDFEDHHEKGVQIVIFGKKDHAEVKGLAGQTNYRTIIVESEKDLDLIDFTRPVHLYAQTTMNTAKFKQLKETIISRSGHTGKESPDVKCTNSICGQVSGRIPELTRFCLSHDLILFVSYKQSSNGKLLYEQCKGMNGNTFFVSETSDINPAWFTHVRNIGITGATSTPRWLLEEFSQHVSRTVSVQNGW